MVRFFCTVCKKVKRVQRWPTIISNQYSTFPFDRIGECNRHTLGLMRPLKHDRVIKVKPQKASAKSGQSSKSGQRKAS